METMSTKTTRSGRSVKRPAKLISEDDGNNEEPMSNLTTKKPVKPLTKVNNMKEVHNQSLFIVPFKNRICKNRVQIVSFGSLL